jgi:hypothetical protein
MGLSLMTPLGASLFACRRFQMLGLILGNKTGCESLFYLLESAFTEGVPSRTLPLKQPW